MLKKLLFGLLAAFAAATALAAVEVNQADQATLETVKGIGPAMSSKILDERKKGSFKDWPDFIDRVKGVGDGNAARFSTDGLTVNGSTYKPGTVAKKDPKAPAKTDGKPAAATAPAAQKK